MKRIVKWIEDNDCLLLAALNLAVTALCLFTDRADAAIGWGLAAIWACRCQAAEHLMSDALDNARTANEAIAGFAAWLKTNTRWTKGAESKKEGGGDGQE